MQFSEQQENRQFDRAIAQYICFARYEDVATWPTRPANPATFEENRVLTGELVMKSTKQMLPLYLTDDTGEFKIEMVGETGGKSYVLRVSLFHPELKSKILGFLNYANTLLLIGNQSAIVAIYLQIH